MEILKNISIDLSEKHNTPMVYAVQGEKNSRKIRFSVFESGIFKVIDTAESVLISYKKSDGYGGVYDVLEDGSAAYEFDRSYRNAVIITLAEQVLTTPGDVHVIVSLISGNSITSTFKIVLNVEENPGIGVVESQDYFSLSVAIDAAIKAVETTLYLVEIDESNNPDKSYNDIVEAYNNNKIVQCKYSGYLLPLKTIKTANCIFSGIFGTSVHTVIVPSNSERPVTILDTPLAPTENIPTKVSDLENDKGYLTEAPVTSVNGQTGDVIVPGTFLVTVTKEDDGTYTSDKTYTDLLMAQATGKTLLCFYANESVYLSLVSSEGKLAFAAISTPYQYRIEFYLSGGDRPMGLRFLKSELASETAVMHIPQALTEEQQAQARENIGIVDGGVLETVVDFTTTETVTRINIPIDTDELVEKFRNMTEFRMAIIIPRDTEDTETATYGKVTVGFQLGWDAGFCSVENAIIAPSLTYSNWSHSYVVIPCNPKVPVSYTPFFITSYKENMLDMATKTNCTSLNSIIRNPQFKKGCSLYITGTQNMAAGTRIIVEVRV